VHVLASTLGQIFSPLFKAMSWLLAFYFSLVPNYIVAIAMLTITVMIISFPLNRASTRSMFKMQLLQPEVQKLRNKYKPSKDTSIAERQEMRQKLNEEMMALYRENNVSMAGGCLPNLVIFPIFIILYDCVRGLTNTCTAIVGQRACATSAQLKGATHTFALWNPRYITTSSKLYHSLASTSPPGKMLSFGLNLANTVRTHQPSWVDVLPFVFMVAMAVGLQYVQLKQMTGRNTQTGQVAQQMQAMQKFMPLIMAVIYISIPAAVNVYFIVSSLFRISQQEWMYRRDPHIMQAFAQLKARKAAGGSTGSAGGKPGGKSGGPRTGGPRGGKPGGPSTGGPKATAPEPTFPPASPIRGLRARLAAALAPDGLEALQAGKTAATSTEGAATNGKSSSTSGGTRPKTGTSGSAGARSGTSGGSGAKTGTAGAKSTGAAKSPGAAKPANGAKPATGSKPGGANAAPPTKNAGSGAAKASGARPGAASSGSPKTSTNGATSAADNNEDDRSQPGAEGKRPRRPR
jgi:YidC/Oxa1 family membrane protein insertase